MNHRSIPSLSSSISSSENNTPRTSSSSCSTTNNYYLYQNFNAPPATEITKLTHTIKRWDDSQLEMELAEDDLIMDKKKSKVRRNSSLRFKQSYIIDKFRHHRQEEKKSIKFTRPFKKLYDWLF
ncbi:hypothetical protein INT48_000868 [Thamnidium elegans]|uniref:Uncharacterized protein n=1 Tax=Thamnidium elegans TaxID=101142 RepID=A0A8H7SY50_9FUNG|nr:hypothetical protein INT48_000868 [Thamnidium elegans]